MEAAVSVVATIVQKVKFVKELLLLGRLGIALLDTIVPLMQMAKLLVLKDLIVQLAHLRQPTVHWELTSQMTMHKPFQLAFLATIINTVENVVFLI